MDSNGQAKIFRLLSIVALVVGLASAVVAAVALTQLHTLRSDVDSSGYDISSLDNTLDDASQALADFKKCVQDFDLSAPYTPGFSNQDIASIKNFPLSRKLPGLTAKDIADAVDANREEIEGHVKLATGAVDNLRDCVEQVKIPEKLGY